jgi:hypothetical protein
MRTTSGRTRSRARRSTARTTRAARAARTPRRPRSRTPYTAGACRGRCRPRERRMTVSARSVEEGERRWFRVGEFSRKRPAARRGLIARAARRSAAAAAHF